MNVWVALVVGLVVGWSIELLVDFFYWRKRRLCPEDTAVAIRAELDSALALNGQLNTSLAARNDRIKALTGDLGTRERELTDVRASLAAKGNALVDAETRLDTCTDEYQALRTEHDLLGASLAAKDVELTDLRAQISSQLEARDAELTRLEHEVQMHRAEQATLEARIGELQSGLKGREAALSDLRGQMEGLDAGAKGLGLGSIFAGGWLAGLKARLAGSEADLKAKDDQIETISAALQTKGAALDESVATLEARQADLAALNEQVRAYSTEKATLEARLDKLGGMVTGREAEIGDLNDMIAAKDAELARLKATISSKDAELSQLATRVSKRDAELAEMKAQLSEMEAYTAVVESERAAGMAQMQPGISGEIPGSRGLSMVWGLNTEANHELAARGIVTYGQLANSSPAQVGDTVSLASGYYPGMDDRAIHRSWVEQARLAASGDWPGLAAYQERFNPLSQRDDLKKLWGIGPKVESLLNDHGIYLFSQVAALPSSRFTEILRTAGRRFQMSGSKLHETWPEQATLADQADWSRLAQLTAKLSWSSVHRQA